jgi:hypothetical protein
MTPDHKRKADFFESRLSPWTVPFLYLIIVVPSMERSVDFFPWDIPGKKYDGPAESHALKESVGVAP